MKKLVVLLAFTLAASVVGDAQSTKKHKPSAAVRNSTQPSTNGPVYEDERQAAPLSPATPAPVKLTSSMTPSDLPTGTAIRMKLETPLSSRANRTGDPFSGRVTEPVVINGRTVIPAGAAINGRLLRVSDPRRIAGVGSVRMLPETVLLPNGKSFAISAAMVDTSTPKKLKVDDEGRIKAKGLSSGDKIEMVSGTGAGAVVGIIAAGSKGFLVGSMIGGGVTVVHWLTKRHSVEVPAGTELIMEINRPMNVSEMPLSAGE